MRDVWITNCDFVGTDVGLRFKSGTGHGGPVRYITADHIFMKDIVNEAILFDTHYDNYPPSVRHPLTHSAEWFATHNEDANKGTPNSPVSQGETEIPEFSGFDLSDIYCVGAGTAISMTGLPNHPIKGITIRNLTITATKGLHVSQAANVILKNVKIHTLESPPASIRDATDFQVVN
jgi:polygalacturonase